MNDNDTLTLWRTSDGSEDLRVLISGIKHARIRISKGLPADGLSSIGGSYLFRDMDMADYRERERERWDKKIVNRIHGACKNKISRIRQALKSLEKKNILKGQNTLGLHIWPGCCCFSLSSFRCCFTLRCALNKSNNNYNNKRKSNKKSFKCTSEHNALASRVSCGLARALPLPLVVPLAHLSFSFVRSAWQNLSIVDMI